MVYDKRKVSIWLGGGLWQGLVNEFRKVDRKTGCRREEFYFERCIGIGNRREKNRGVSK